MTEIGYRPELAPEQRYALASAARNLGEQFSGVFGTATIERFLYASYEQFAEAATVPTFLPLLAERFARQRLRALARVEGHERDGKPTVLFLCTHNAGRSQMALGWCRQLARGPCGGLVGGSEPSREMNPSAVAVMREVGIDISGEFPSPGPPRWSGPPTWW